MTTEGHNRTAVTTNGNGIEPTLPQAPLMPRPQPAGQLEEMPWRSAPDERPTGRPKVVIVGAGFGGITAAQRLADRNVDVLLIDRNNYHGFWPLLYQVALSGLEAESIAYPVRAVIQNHKNLHFRLGTVVGVDFDARQVRLGDGDAVDYDYLVLAAGSANNYFGNDQLAKQTYGLKDLDDALALRNAILEAFETAANTEDLAKQQQLLTFAIIGGGPTGVELAGTLAELVKFVLRKDFPQLDTSKVRIVVIEASKDVLGPFSEGLRHNAKQQLERRGIELRLGQPVTAVENGVVTFKDGTTLPAKTVVWAAGVRGALLADALGVEMGRGARVKVTPTLQLPKHPEVYVIGDMAYLEGFKGDQAYPMVAPVAMQMAKTAAYNILASVNKRSPKHFSYFDKGSMATIGRRSAVFESFGIRMTGLLAWLGWLFVHLIMLIGFRNRAVVLFNWFWNYVTFDGGTRLIIRRKYQYTHSDKASTDDPKPGSKQPSGQKEAEYQREAGYQAQATTL